MAWALSCRSCLSSSGERDGLRDFEALSGEIRPIGVSVAVVGIVVGVVT